MARRFVPSRSRPKRGQTADLTTKERLFVEATVLGAPSQLQAAVAAGYSDPKAHASAIAARPIVAAAIEERRSAAMREANVDLARVYRNLVKYNDDDRDEVRSSAVRSGELLLKAAGELQPDVRVTVDNRTLVLPGMDPATRARAYQALFGVSREAPATDGGTEP